MDDEDPFPSSTLMAEASCLGTPTSGVTIWAEEDDEEDDEEDEEEEGEPGRVRCLLASPSGEAPSLLGVRGLFPRFFTNFSLTNLGSFLLFCVILVFSVIRRRKKRL